MSASKSITKSITRSSLDVARESYRSISLYAPNRAPARIDVSDNTNLWGIPPTAERMIRDAAVEAVTRYPALYVVDVKRAIADYLQVAPEMIVTGCGSDDVLDSAIRAFGEPGDRVAYPDPSFAMIPIFAKMNGLDAVGVPLTTSYDADAEGLLATDAKIIYLCSPNNPTGTAMTRQTIETVVARAPGLVFIDEAYAEFAETNALDLLQGTPNVVITRTMSKAFGLAGLRIGYAIGDPTIVAEIEKSRGPYKVNALAERAAVAALTTDRAWVMARVQDAKVNRDRMIDVLRAMGLDPLPSQANFVLVPVPFDAVAIDQALRTRGIAVRPFTNLSRIGKTGNALRISVGPWEILDECLRALGDVLREIEGRP